MAIVTETRIKILSIAGVVALTVGIHYGWILEPIFGQSHWIHAIHGRFCYIPIVIAASFFGMRGGLWVAAVISALVLPYILGTDQSEHNRAGEYVEIVFYFAIAVLAGALTDRERRSRRRQEQTQLQLERSHKLSMVGQMAAGVAHEIKNPLASIKGGVEILCSDSTADEERSEFREIVTREIRRIDNTVKEFLDFARPRESRMEPVDLAEVTAAAVKQLETQAGTAGIRMVRSSEAKVMIRADREKIHQVVLNLLLNAIDVSAAGDVVEVTAGVNGRGQAELTVRDHGPGIDPAEAERIFEPFYTRKSAGSGLGLAIVKSIVESHRGDVSFKPAAGGGVVFAVTLPLSEEA
jgi:signal transduction histidine kinase